MPYDGSSPLRQGRLARRLSLGGLVAAVLVSAAPAAAEIGPWAKGDHIRARLVISAPDAAKATATPMLGAAVEIEMGAGWKTYWRTPGDGGIPPKFDFSRSGNLGGTEVHYPAPVRVDDGYAVSNVYVGRVVLPVDVRPADPNRAVRLDLKLDVGVCEKVCIPVQLRMTVEGGRASDAKAMAVIDEGRRALPVPAMTGVFAVTSAARAGGTDDVPEFGFKAIIPGDAEPVIFVEGPPDWFPGVPKITKREGGQAAFQVKVDRLGSKVPVRGATLRVTIVAGDRRMEQQLKLD